MSLLNGECKNFAIVANQHQIIDILYNIKEPPIFPPNERGQKIEAIEFTNENIDLNFWYDAQTKQFYNYNLPQPDTKEILGQEEQLFFEKIIKIGQDKIILELIKNELL